MHAAKIIVSEIERERGFQVFPLLTESISQSRKSSHRHSDIKILSLNMRRANLFRVRVAKARGWYSLNNFGRRIAMLVRFGRTVNLD